MLIPCDSSLLGVRELALHKVLQHDSVQPKSTPDAKSTALGYHTHLLTRSHAKHEWRQARRRTSQTNSAPQQFTSWPLRGGERRVTWDASSAMVCKCGHLAICMVATFGASGAPHRFRPWSSAALMGTEGSASNVVTHRFSVVSRHPARKDHGTRTSRPVPRIRLRFAARVPRIRRVISDKGPHQVGALVP